MMIHLSKTKEQRFTIKPIERKRKTIYIQARANRQKYLFKIMINAHVAYFKYFNSCIRSPTTKFKPSGHSAEYR